MDPSSIETVQINVLLRRRRRPRSLCFRQPGFVCVFVSGEDYLVKLIEGV